MATDPNHRALIRILADGHFHSGEQLGEYFGITRAAVNKRIQQLEDFGLRIHSVVGRGYRLVDAIDVLDKAQIKKKLNPQSSQVELYVEDCLDSTNTFLLSRSHYIMPPAVCLAEYQSQGRGRRGKTWMSPYGSNIYLSLLWQFPGEVAALSGLSLAVGVSLATSLEARGIAGIALKWPNDLYACGKKIGGILVEVSPQRAESSQDTQSVRVVIGVGLNIRLSEEHCALIDQDAMDLTRLGFRGSRNDLCACIINKLYADLMRFNEGGFAGFCADWNQRNLYFNQAVEIHQPKSRLLGICGPVNHQGELILSTHQGEFRIQSGEVSLRKVKAESLGESR